MIGTTHRPAAIPRNAQVEALRRKDDKANKLGPESIVTVINRGRESFERKFDGEDYLLKPYTHNGGTDDAPFLMQMPFGAAMHFQKHCPVPGTRDPNSNTLAAESFLGILDTDEPELCRPFTEDECRQFGQAIEAIERLDTDATKVIDVRQAAKRRSGQGGLGNNTSHKPQFTTGEDADRQADAIARHAMQAPDGVSDEIASEAAEGEAELATSGGGGRSRRR